MSTVDVLCRIVTKVVAIETYLCLNDITKQTKDAIAQARSDDEVGVKEKNDFFKCLANPDAHTKRKV